MKQRDSVLKQALGELQNGRGVVLCTLIETRGSAPQSVPAHLAVMSDGRTAGTIGGGCIEGDVWFKAEELKKRGGKFEIVSHTLNEEIAADSGLTCGGTVTFMLQNLSADERAEVALMERLAAAHNGENDRVTTFTLIECDKSTDFAVGVKYDLGAFAAGSEVGGELNGKLNSDNGKLSAGSAKLGAESLRILESVRSGAAEVTESATGKLFRDPENGCAYFVELHAAPSTIFVLGAGHVGEQVASLANFLQRRVVVIDDRADFANAERFPYAEVYAEPFETALPKLSVTPSGSIVIVTRGHKDDLAALRAALATPANYIGLMGSKRKVILLYKELAKLGYSETELARLHAPIGLAVGATSPAEIAVSIMAEVLAHASDEAGGSKKYAAQDLKGVFGAAKSYAG